MEPAVRQDGLVVLPRFGRPVLERGALVVFWRTRGGERLRVLKRIVGLPGETVEIQHGMASIHGIDWSDTYGHHDPTAAPSAIVKDGYRVTLAADEVFVLGDNRDWSVDSRTFGAVRVDAVIGTPRPLGSR